MYGPMDDLLDEQLPKRRNLNSRRNNKRRIVTTMRIVWMKKEEEEEWGLLCDVCRYLPQYQ